MDYNFKNLVFEGGGVKGIAFAGALIELKNLNYLQNIQRVAGTSAGAITATLIAVGYTPEEILSIISKTDFSKFEDNTFLFIRDIIRLIKRYGWNKGDKFSNWIGELIKQKTGSSDTTFAELKEKSKIDLFMVCSNISKQRAEVLSYETTPNLKIKDGVRMSMGIPVFFTSVSNENNDVMVDGAVTWNYPVNIFDNVKYLDNILNCIPSSFEDGYVFNYETLGFRVDSTTEINYAKNDWQTEPIDVKNIKKFIIGLMNFTMDMVNKKHLQADDWNRTVFIDSGAIKTTQFKLSGQEVQFLVDNGKKALKDYFNWKNNDKKNSTYPIYKNL